MRLASIDVLRMVAIAVMVFVHFGENLSGYTPAFSGIGAPLFTFLVGASYFLWSDGKLAHGMSKESLSKVSVRRGLFIFGAGFVFNIMVWLPEGVFNWDVLTFIGIALLLLNVVRRMPPFVAPLMAVLVVCVSPLFRLAADYHAYWDGIDFTCDLTTSEVLIGFLSTGYIPIFPWIAFPLVGYAVASSIFAPQLDEHEKLRRLRLVGIIGCALMAASVTLFVCKPWLPVAVANEMLGNWTMFPPTTVYVLGVLGMAIVLLTALHRWIDLNPKAQRFQSALAIAKTFSQYSLTIYVVHHIVHLWPLWIYGLVTTGDPTKLWSVAMPTTVSIPLAALFLAICFVVLRALGPGRSRGIEWWMRWLCD